MKINKKQLQNIIMIIIVIIAMVGFSFWVKQKIAKKNVVQNQDRAETIDIDLTPRPIEEFLVSNNIDFREEETRDINNCDNAKILEDRAKKISNGKLDDVGHLTLGENCWITYENNIFKFSFRDLNNSGLVELENSKAVSLGLSEDLTVGTEHVGVFLNEFEKDKKYELKNYLQDISAISSESKTFIKTERYVNSNGTLIDISTFDDTWTDTSPIQKYVYTIFAPAKNGYIRIHGTAKDGIIRALLTIELK